MELFKFLLCALVVLISAVVRFLHKNLSYWKDRGVPYVKPHFFYGSFRDLRTKRIFHEVYREVYRKFKGKAPFCGVYFFQKQSAFILDPALAKNILIKDFTSFTNRGVFYNERDDPLSGHLFALDGNKWKRLRQKLTPTFTSGKMKFMFPTVVKVGEEFVRVFGEMTDKNKIVEIKELLARFTTDVIGTCAFGIDCNSLRDPNAEFRLMGRKFLENTRHGRIVTNCMRSFPALARKWGMRIIPDEIHEFFMRIVRETVILREEKNIRRNDFMDLLIELKNKKEIVLENGETLSGLSMEEVAAQAFVFFVAGFETSSTTMGFALYEMAQHQDIQDKVRNEVNEVLAKHKNEFTYDCVKDMHYLDQVISETLRMYTILPHLSRQAVEDYVVPGYPNFTIEKGIFVIIPAAAYHNDPELYPEPNVFNPDRFSHDMVKQRDSVEWLPFGDGPRNCIGMRFGQMQARIGLALLLKQFRFSVCKETKIPMEFNVKSFLLSAKGGIFLRVDKI